MVVDGIAKFQTLKFTFQGLKFPVKSPVLLVRKRIPQEFQALKFQNSGPEIWRIHPPPFHTPPFACLVSCCFSMVFWVWKSIKKTLIVYVGFHYFLPKDQGQEDQGFTQETPTRSETQPWPPWVFFAEVRKGTAGRGRPSRRHSARHYDNLRLFATSSTFFDSL